MPILDNIISADAFSLEYIQFPWIWRGRSFHNASGGFYPIVEFERRYSQQLNNKRLGCSKCNEDLNDNMWLNNRLVATKICYDCLEPICLECQLLHVNDGNKLLHSCTRCDKTYCRDCALMERCSQRLSNCSNKICRGCQEMNECSECGHISCEDCINTCDGCNRPLCENCARRCQDIMCTKLHCDVCYNGKEYSVEYCDECGMKYCLECKVDNVETYEKDGIGACRGCAANAIPLIIKEMTKLRSENEELAKEVEELRAKVERTEL